MGLHLFPVSVELSENVDIGKSLLLNDSSALNFTMPSFFLAWDQSDKFMKLYVSIPGLMPTDKDKVTCNFIDHGVTLDATNIQEKNYHLSITNLAKAITPDSSHWKVKDGEY